jgi:Cupin
MEAQFMDPLSDICSFLEVKDLMTAQLRWGGPWSVALCDQSRGSVILTVALKGSFWLSVDGVDAPILIQEGDYYVLSSRSHSLHSEPETKSVPIAPLSPNDIDIEKLEATFPFSNEPMNITDGARLIIEEVKAGSFFDLLPPVIHVRADSTHAPILRSVLSVLTYEAKQPRAGNQL